MTELVAHDYFTVSTVGFKALLVLIMLAHHRRKVIHCRVTAHPNRNGPPSNWSRPSSGRPSIGIVSGTAMRCVARGCNGAS